MSYRPMVQVNGKWSGNSLRFATEDEAMASARDLMRRWTLVENYGAERSDDPVNCALARDNQPPEVITCAT